MKEKEVYHQIKNDSEIHYLYSRIHNYEERTGGYAYHDFAHACNVSRTVEKILRQLGATEEIIYSAKIAALLHDTGAVEGKQDHALRSYRFASEYLKKYNCCLRYKEHILSAIKNHSDGFHDNNLITASLIIADKLDISAQRITYAGTFIIGNRQYANVKSVHIDIQPTTLLVTLDVNDDFNEEEFNDYYFTEKIILSVKNFAKILQRDTQFIINNPHEVSQSELAFSQSI